MKLIINQNQAINELEITISCPAIDRRVKNLIDYIRQYSTSIPGVIDGMNVSVPLDTILYIESIDRKTFFYDKRRVFEGKETLSSLENKLDNSLFVRISKSCIVNIAFIASSYPMDNHRIGLVLKDGERLVVGRTYAEKLESRLSAFNLNLENETVEKDFAAETTDNSIISSILNNNKILHFHERPQRIVAVTYTCAELLCALGLEDRIIGIASISNDLDSVLPKYREKLKDIPIIHYTDPSTGTIVPIRQDLTALEPDFVLSTNYYHQYLERAGKGDYSFPFYVMESSIPGKTSMEFFYRDIFNIGKIFGVERQALLLVETLRDKMLRIPTHPFKKNRARVFVFDRGKNTPVTSFRDTLENHLITLAGGVNIFGEKPGMYQKVSWESVSALNPDYIIVHDYMDYMDAQEKIDWIKSETPLRECAAVQKDHFVILKLSEVFPGIQNAIAAEKMCEAFDPETM